MLSCVRPRVLAYVADAVNQDRLAITEDLAVVKRSRDAPRDNTKEDYPSRYDAADPSKRKLLRTLMLEKLDAYLSSHHLEAKLPEAIVGSNIVPRSLVDSMPKSLTIPLGDSSDEQGNLMTKLHQNQIAQGRTQFGTIRGFNYLFPNARTKSVSFVA